MTNFIPSCVFFWPLAAGTWILISPCFAVDIPPEAPVVIQLRDEASPILRADIPELLFDMSIVIDTGNKTKPPLAFRP